MNRAAALPVLTALAGLAALAALAACSGRTAVPPGTRVGPALAAALAAADQAREPWRCAAPDGPGAPDQTLEVGGRTWRLAGHTLARSGAGDVAIGVIADAAGAAPATLAALGRLRRKLARVDLVVSLGGMGATAAELQAVFAALAEGAPWPLVALPGDLEPVEAQADAVAAVRRRGAAVIDGRLVHRIELAAATIALVPGAGATSRLVAGADGCRYQPADVAAAFADLTPRAGLRIVALAEPPREPGDPLTGDLAVTPGVGHAIDLALHAATRDAATAARRGGRDGAATALTPGSSDATPRLPGPRRVPTAGILTVRGTTWVWQPVDDVE